MWSLPALPGLALAALELLVAELDMSPSAERPAQRGAVGRVQTALAAGVDLTFASCVALACYFPLPA